MTNKDEKNNSISFECLDPHFLFNALNTIKCSAILNSDTTITQIDFLGKYLQYLFLHTQNIEPVLAREELDFVKNYCELEKARFSNLKVFYEVECAGFYIPAFSIKGIVHNAIHHGVLSRKQGGKVFIHLYREGNEAVVEVLDNGMGMASDKMDAIWKKDTFLSKLKKQLMHNNGRLELKSVEKEGTKIRICIKEENDFQV